MATKTETNGVDLKEKEKEIISQYPNVVKGTIRRETKGHHAGKVTVEIKCCDCKEKRRVATSDLFQVKRCVEHTAEHRNALRRANGKPTTIKGGKTPTTKLHSTKSKVNSAGIKKKVVAKRAAKTKVTPPTQAEGVVAA